MKKIVRNRLFEGPVFSIEPHTVYVDCEFVSRGTIPCDHNDFLNCQFIGQLRLQGHDARLFGCFVGPAAVPKERLQQYSWDMEFHLAMT